MFDIKEFYPTPSHIISKMIEGIDFRMINTILEPSAGKGDIVQRVFDKIKSNQNCYSSKEVRCDIDCIEVDENLQHILRGKDFRVVHDDFLTYYSYKRYDLILMNPPFANGDKHLLKALEMQKNGGAIVCLLNSETIKNPYSNIRKDLVGQLEKLNAEIIYIPDAFTDAERKTGVEIALIKVLIPKKEEESIIVDTLKQEEVHAQESEDYSNKLINADFIKGIVEQYNFEVRVGLKLISEYRALQPMLINKLRKDTFSKEIISISLNNADKYKTLENGYIQEVRYKFWDVLFQSPQFIEQFTSNLRYEYSSKINELKDYDFSLYNIYSIRLELSKKMSKGIEDTIISLFEEFSHKHYWDKSASSNIHYYNGWKTNSCYSINKKVIIPLNAFSWSTFAYGYEEKISDMHKVFDYLSGSVEKTDIREILKQANDNKDYSKIPFKYFNLTCYKKGTTHIEFTDLEILKKFNIFGSQRKNWLPPTYGKSDYKNMTAEEKDVVDNFEGEKSYNQVVKNKEYYICDSSKMLLLA